MRILLINNDGAGFADHIDIESGTTIERLFASQCHGAKASDYLIRINRQPASRDQMLIEGDRVSITPRKIEGAHSGGSFRTHASPAAQSAGTHGHGRRRFAAARVSALVPAAGRNLAAGG